MPGLPMPPDEKQRLEALRAYGIRDEMPGDAFDHVVRLASRLLAAPVAVISVVGENTVGFVSRHGLPVAAVRRCDAFCAQAILGEGSLVVCDAREDPRFCAGPLVAGQPAVRFYAGCPIAAPDGSRVGALAVMGREPRVPSDDDLEALCGLARCAEDAVSRAVSDTALALFQESEARRHAILDSILDGVITIDESSAIQVFNHGAERMFGWRADEVLGRSVSILIPEPHRSRHDAYVSEHQGGEPSPVLGRPREVTGVRKDGTTFPMELAVTEVRGHAGRLFVGVARDLGERRRSEQVVRMQATALEAAANAIVITDAEGTVRWVNPAFTALTGYSKEDVIGRNPRALRSGKHDDAFYSGMWQTILAGRVWHGEVINRHKDGHLYTEEMTITPVIDAAGAITDFVAIKQDISARKEVERMKSEFVSTVSHELRTPLTSIRGSLGLIAGGVAGELQPQMKRLIEIALNNSDRLVRLVNDILDVEKIDSGRMEFRMGSVDLVGLVRHAIEANHAYAAQYGVTCTLVEAPEAAVVTGDADRLTQVMTNLLSNAAKFSPQGGSVSVAIAGEDGRVRVAVADRGPGIPPEFRKHIFQRFAQADSSDTRQKGGTGLGLSIARAIVERHGGQIGFDTQVGVGTTFFFEIPAGGPPS